MRRPPPSNVVKAVNGYRLAAATWMRGDASFDVCVRAFSEAAMHRAIDNVVIGVAKISLRSHLSQRSAMSSIDA
jgi:hypothetical protein